jgi:hypothetical protein
MTENIFNTFFNVNEAVKLSKDDKEYLKELEEAMYDLLEEEGSVGTTKIKEIVLDELLKSDKLDIIAYLGLEIEDDINENLEEKLQDENFLKREEAEGSKDFFEKYLEDPIINDLVMSLMGFERKSEGTKEIFVKKRSAKIPTGKIVAIGDILKSKFNQVEFLSEKEDQEQAHIITLAYSLVFDILLEIPYEICNTEKTIEILSIVVVKLSNAIGLSKNFRSQLMTTIEASYQSKKNLGGDMHMLTND